MTPEVSICIPAFNAEATLERCLLSVAGQELAGVEVLLVDNCSTDGTREVVDRAKHAGLAVRLERNEKNLGRIENWNRCLELARGRFVKFLMASDVLWAGSVALLLRIALEERVVMVGSQHQFWDGRLWPPPRVAAARSAVRYSPSESIRAVAAGLSPFWALNGLLFAREPARAMALRFVEEVPYLADSHFCMQLAQAGDFVFLRTPTYWFNTGVSTRFHYKGLDAVRLFSETSHLVKAARSILAGRAESAPATGVALLATLARELDTPSSALALRDVRAGFAGEPPHVRGFAAGLWAFRRAGLRRHAWSLLRFLERRFLPSMKESARPATGSGA